MAVLALDSPEVSRAAWLRTWVGLAHAKLSERPSLLDEFLDLSDDAADKGIEALLSVMNRPDGSFPNRRHVGGRGDVGKAAHQGAARRRRLDRFL